MKFNDLNKRLWSESEEDDDYRGMHRPPEKSNGAPLWDLDGAITGSEIYPDDIYGPMAFRYYGYDPMDNDALAKIREYRRHPNRQIRIYRAVPKTIEKSKQVISQGDWVTITKKYAVQHGEGPLRGEYIVLSKVVYARDIFTNGDSVQEWGYDPQPFVPETWKKMRDE